MALDPQTLLAYEIPEVRQRLTRRDVALYALSAGLGQDPLDPAQLDFVDPDRGLVVLPTMATVLGHPGFWLADPRTTVDAGRLVHGEQSVTIHRALPVEGEVVGRTVITGLVDKGAGRGALLYSEKRVTDAVTGVLLATTESTTFLRADGGFAGAGLGQARPPQAMPSGPPELCVDLPTRPEQALYYRLNGDMNPLHSRPEAAALAGFPRPILHGLCTMAVVCHALLRGLAGYDAAGAPVHGAAVRGPGVSRGDDPDRDVAGRGVPGAGGRAGCRRGGSRAGGVRRDGSMSGMMLEGKVAVVTGAGGGIGREIAVAMALAGAAVVVNDVGASLAGEGLSGTPAEQTRQIIEQRGGRAVICTDSVAEWGSAQRIVQAALDAFGRVDVVVNNAGILRDAIFHRMTAEEWLSVVNVHLNGSFFVSRAAAEHFRRQEGGAYVHMTSTSGLVGNFGQANYSAAKLGITALSKSIALDMARFGVRSNCIAPFAWSRMTSAIPAETADQKARVAKLQQMTPDKNAPLAVFLAADAAAGISGQVFATRHNEIFLMSQSRPVRSVHRGEGWTPETIAEHAAPALRSSLYALDRSQDVFGWDPV